MRVPTTIGCALPLLLALACGPAPAPGDTDAEPTSTTTSSTTGTTTGTTLAPTTSEGDTTTGEACLEATRPGELWSDQEPALTCGGPELCPGGDPIYFELDGPIFDGDFSAPTSAVTDLERARCLAVALRDRTPGQFMFMPGHSPQVLHVFGLEIVGEFAVTRSDRSGCELSHPEPKSCHVRERLRQLRPPAFFADCVDGDALALWQCLYHAAEPEPACAAGPLVCPP
ncbi:hypothetical protein [Nannocystis bainbridge]|uniref:Secreted protein n=1 Tax=Nannocystis bainbridge TaxID=2995303 RepID=A0ABT5DS80_9BACT|nr:hypothetical protein [Nannocystis bainbridge]MDC0716490.1 hypothetical protein [Nannocystis bainbridge]